MVEYFSHPAAITTVKLKRNVFYKVGYKTGWHERSRTIRFSHREPTALRLLHELPRLEIVEVSDAGRRFAPWVDQEFWRTGVREVIHFHKPGVRIEFHRDWHWPVDS